MNTSIGAQLGVKVVPGVKALELDVSLFSLKFLSTIDEFDKGDYKGVTIGYGDMVYSKGKDERLGMEVESKFGISLGGLGGEMGINSRVDRDNYVLDSKKFYKVNASKEGFGSSVIFEKPRYGDQFYKKVVQEYSFGAKLILGFEIKVTAERAEKQ
jgi:hypothetical protein